MKQEIKFLAGSYEGSSITEPSDDVSIDFVIKYTANNFRYQFRSSHYTNHGYECIGFEGDKWKIDGDELILYPEITETESWEDYFKNKVKKSYSKSIHNLKIIEVSDANFELIYKDYKLWKIDS
jgi:hypothetical protein